ncbi:MAG: ABC transporter permease [Candidatus Sulfopaludibacter sp.]|nr:ABC transporter permease [Candidatus Sulfopaludibacter sp.]
MRTTLRMLARRPGFSVLATLTLALGITATTVVFSFAYGVLLSPLPYSNARRLMLLWEFDRTARTDPGENLGPVTTVPPQDLLAWQQQTRTMESLDALTFGFFSINQGASPTEVIGGRVTPGFFRTIGVQPMIGRAFAPGDPDDVVVLGYDLWQTQYGGDRAIVGRQILFGDGRYTVLGVLPPQFFFYMREFALWAPLSLRPGGRRPRPVMGVGLLRPGVTEPEAQAEFDAIASRLESQSPATNRNRGARVTSVRAQYSRFYRPVLGVLLASVGFLLLIACANVASLLLARATERHREMAIRAALGATRWQIVRQLLAESLALALFAGATGVAAALFLVPLARTLLPMKLPVPLPGVDQIAISTPVLLFSSTVSMVTVLLFGLAPALRSATAALGARSTSMAQRRFLDAIVVAELALAVLLLTGAGLVMRSEYSLYHGTGFRVDHILTFRTPTAGLPPQRLVRFYQDVIGGLRVLPGVRTAAAAYGLPGGGSNGQSPLFAEGGSTDPKDAVPTAVNQVSGEFFGALDIPILAGRTFSGRDGADAPPVAVLSVGLARRLFGRGDPIGKRVRIGGQAPEQWLRVTGIAGDVRPMLSQAPRPTLYRPFTQDTPGAIGFVIRSEVPPLDLAPVAEKTVWQIRPGQPITYVGSLEGDLDQQGFRERLSAIGLGWFAGFGLVLAAIGIYGLIAYVVKQRLREFGVRMALGATADDVVALVLRRGAVLIATGLLLGVGASLALTRALKSVLYGVQAIDLPTFAAAAAVLAAVGMAACYLPARKASGVNPMTVLRSE